MLNERNVSSAFFEEGEGSASLEPANGVTIIQLCRTLENSQSRLLEVFYWTSEGFSVKVSKFQR